MKKLFLLMMLLCANSFAQDARAYQDWVVGPSDNGGVFAITTNADHEILMKSCDLKATCLWSVGMKIKCDGGFRSPVLFNSSSGVVVHTLQCTSPVVINGVTIYRSLIDDPDGMDNIISSGGGVIGMAYALDSGWFEVSRFSAMGGSDAIKALLHQPKPPSPSNTDTHKYKM